jgi:hypothetical protein
MNTHSQHYAIQAVLVYVALGVALGMVGWALLIHNGGRSGATGTPAKRAPAQTDAPR